MTTGWGQARSHTLGEATVEEVSFRAVSFRGVSFEAVSQCHEIKTGALRKKILDGKMVQVFYFKFDLNLILSFKIFDAERLI